MTRICAKNKIINPVTILGPLAWWYRADQGITISTGVSQWNDLSGNGINISQGIGANQPTFNSNAINSRPAITFDGSNDFLYGSWTRDLVGTTPMYWWLICKQITWTNNDHLINDTGCAIYQNTSTPNVRSFNAANGSLNNNLVLSSYRRVEALNNNTTGSYLNIGSVNVTGTNTGNNPQTANYIILGSAFTGGNPATPVGQSNIEIAEAFCFRGTPTLQNRIDLDQYCTIQYGIGLT